MTYSTEDILFDVEVHSVRLEGDREDPNNVYLVAVYNDKSEQWYVRGFRGWKIMPVPSEYPGYSHACGYHE